MFEYIQYEYYDADNNYAHHYIVLKLLKLLKAKNQTNILETGLLN